MPYFSIILKFESNACSVLCATESIMEPYLRFLHTYVSVSGPHLGYLYSSNSLFNSGMWLLKKFKGTQCIHQLTFTDDPDLQNTFLYKLCEVLKILFCLFDRRERFCAIYMRVRVRVWFFKKKTGKVSCKMTIYIFLEWFVSVKSKQTLPYSL